MRFLDLIGTSSTKFYLGIKGLLLKNASGKIRARNATDSADVPLVGSSIEASGDSLTLNEDAAGAGSDWKLMLSRAAAGMTQDLNFTFPANYGTNGYFMATDGAGGLTFMPSAAASNLEATDTTTLAFGSTSPLAMFTLPVNAVVVKVQIVIDTPFNGTPSVSIGVAGTTSRYMPSTAVDLTQAAGTIFEVSPGVAAEGTPQDLIATYAAGTASAGSARILVSYVIPS